MIYSETYRQQLYEFIPMLTYSRNKGVKVDEDKLYEIQLEFENKLQAKLAELHQLDSRLQGININSPQQVAEYLYDVKNYVYFKKEFRTTADKALGYLYKKYADPVIPLIGEARKISHFLGSFVHAIVTHIELGRVYPSVSQMKVTTRWSMNNPNMQQQPSRDPGFKKFKEVFVADPGNYFVQADYQQLEFRIAAGHCQDENMISFIKEGKDVHRYMAALLYGIKEQDVTYEQRSNTKSCNFGKLYRQSAKQLAELHDIPLSLAQEIHAIFDQLFPEWQKWNQYIIDFVNTHGYVEAKCGRVRRFPYITRDNSYKVYNEAVNFPIQCDGQAVTSLASLELYNKGYDWRFNVHDSIVLQCPKSELDMTISRMRKVMEQDFYGVPLGVDIGYGLNWGDLREV